MLFATSRQKCVLGFFQDLPRCLPCIACHAFNMFHTLRADTFFHHFGVLLEPPFCRPGRTKVVQGQRMNLQEQNTKSPSAGARKLPKKCSKWAPLVDSLLPEIPFCYRFAPHVATQCVWTLPASQPNPKLVPFPDLPVTQDSVAHQKSILSAPRLHCEPS